MCVRRMIVIIRIDLSMFVLNSHLITTLLTTQPHSAFAQTNFHTSYEMKYAKNITCDATTTTTGCGLRLELECIFFLLEVEQETVFFRDINNIDRRIIIASDFGCY